MDDDEIKGFLNNILDWEMIRDKDDFSLENKTIDEIDEYLYKIKHQYYKLGVEATLYIKNTNLEKQKKTVNIDYFNY